MGGGFGFLVMWEKSFLISMSSSLSERSRLRMNCTLESRVVGECRFIQTVITKL